MPRPGRPPTTTGRDAAKKVPRRKRGLATDVLFAEGQGDRSSRRMMDFDIPEEDWPIYDLLDAAEDEGPSSTGPRPQLRRFLVESAALVGRRPASSDAHFIRGFALLLLSRQDVAVSHEALGELTAAIRLRPTHQWARYHAIELFHQASDHSAVVHHFVALDREFFVQDDKDWRYIVAWEWAVDAWARLGQVERFEAELAGLVGAYLSYASDPEEILPRPGHLVRLSRDLRAGLVASLPQTAAQLLNGQLGLLVPGGWIRESDLVQQP